MAVTGLITRTSLSLADLALDNTVFEIRRGFDVGPVAWRRNLVKSPYVDDAFEVSSVREQPIMNLSLFVKGSSESAIATSAGLVIAAVSQQAYELAITVDGTPFRWACNRADYALLFGDEHLYAQRGVLNLTIPRKSLPINGPI